MPVPIQTRNYPFESLTTDPKTLPVGCSGSGVYGSADYIGVDVSSVWWARVRVWTSVTGRAHGDDANRVCKGTAEEKARTIEILERAERSETAGAPASSLREQGNAAGDYMEV